MKKKTIIIAVLIVAGLLFSIFFLMFGFTTVNTFPNESESGFFRKVSNKNNTLNILKLNINKLEAEDLIVHKNPTNFDTRYSKKENYLSRLIGKPGDLVLINDSKVFVNGGTLPEDYNLYFLYRVTMEDSVNFENLLSGYKVKIIEVMAGNLACDFVTSQDQADEIAKNENVVNLRKIIKVKNTYVYGLFPSDPVVPWNPDNFGPVVVPQKGTTVKLTRKNIPVYRYIIDIYEENELLFDYTSIHINGKKVTEYTFQKDYYFVLNDNRYENQDSKTWGFIPEDQIVGRLIN